MAGVVAVVAHLGRGALFGVGPGIIGDGCVRWVRRGALGAQGEDAHPTGQGFMRILRTL